jgi:hypothetical protein
MGLYTRPLQLSGDVVAAIPVLLQLPRLHSFFFLGNNIAALLTEIGSAKAGVEDVVESLRGSPFGDLLAASLAVTDPTCLTLHLYATCADPREATWGRGRVTLLGDSMHAMGPTGVGLTLALQVREGSRPCSDDYCISLVFFLFVYLTGECQLNCKECHLLISKMRRRTRTCSRPRWPRAASRPRPCASTRSRGGTCWPRPRTRPRRRTR